jgi:alkaline phosphatase
MKRFIFFFIYGLWSIQIHSETPLNRTAPVGHSHNDYHQKQPFKTAMEAGMNSIEVDIFLKKDYLCVSHSKYKLNTNQTLDALYLSPIAEAVRNGEKYPSELLIDVKTEAYSTLNVILEALKTYPDVFNAQSLIKIIISGKRPNPSDWEKYPPYIFFDGRPNEHYTDCQWEQIGMVSSSFKHYKSFWIGKCKMLKLKKTIEFIHKKGKTVRFWKTRDNVNSWKRLAKLGVDVINTDKPMALKKFLDMGK